MRYHYTQTRSAQILKDWLSRFNNGTEQLKLSDFASGNAKWYDHFGKEHLYYCYCYLNKINCRNSDITIKRKAIWSISGKEEVKLSPLADDIIISKKLII